MTNDDAERVRAYLDSCLKKEREFDGGDLKDMGKAASREIMLRGAEAVRDGQGYHMLSWYSSMLEPLVHWGPAFSDIVAGLLEALGTRSPEMGKFLETWWASLSVTQLILDEDAPGDPEGVRSLLWALKYDGLNCKWDRAMNVSAEFVCENLTHPDPAVQREALECGYVLAYPQLITHMAEGLDQQWNSNQRSDLLALLIHTMAWPGPRARDRQETLGDLRRALNSSGDKLNRFSTYKCLNPVIGEKDELPDKWAAEVSGPVSMGDDALKRNYGKLRLWVERTFRSNALQAELPDFVRGALSFGGERSMRRPIAEFLAEMERSILRFVPAGIASGDGSSLLELKRAIGVYLLSRHGKKIKVKKLLKHFPQLESPEGLVLVRGLLNEITHDEELCDTLRRLRDHIAARL